MGDLLGPLQQPLSPLLCCSHYSLARLQVPPTCLWVHLEHGVVNNTSADWLIPWLWVLGYTMEQNIREWIQQLSMKSSPRPGYIPHPEHWKDWWQCMIFQELILMTYFPGIQLAPSFTPLSLPSVLLLMARGFLQPADDANEPLPTQIRCNTNRTQKFKQKSPKQKTDLWSVWTSTGLLISKT